MHKIVTIVLLMICCSAFGQTEYSIYDQDKETVTDYFQKETIGGKLDFELKMKDDKAPFYRVGNILYNRKDFGILLWAQAIKMSRKFSKKEAIKLWEEIKKRKLTKPERKAFKKGFTMELENKLLMLTTCIIHCWLDRAYLRKSSRIFYSVCIC